MVETAMSNSKGWVGVDLDGTLAEYESTPEDQWDPLKIGKPIPRMVERVKGWLADGIEVRIVTARVAVEPGRAADMGASISASLLAEQCRDAIMIWLEDNGMAGVKAVQCHKDYGMLELWDDRAVQVVKNTGLTLDEYQREVEKSYGF